MKNAIKIWMKCRLSGFISGVSQEFCKNYLEITAIFTPIPSLQRLKSNYQYYQHNYHYQYYFWYSMKILCSQWLPELWNPWTSLELRQSGLQSLLVCQSFCLQFCLQRVKSYSIGFRSDDWLVRLKNSSVVRYVRI